MPKKPPFDIQGFNLHLLAFREALDHCLKSGHWHAASRLLRMLDSVICNHAPPESKDSWERGQEAVTHSQLLVLDWLAFLGVDELART